jgi:hypothetical protein
MHMPDLRRLLPLILLINANRINPQSAFAILHAYSLEGIPQVLGDPESRLVVDSDGAAQNGRATAIRKRVEGFRRIQLFDFQGTTEGVAELASLETEDSDPRL